MPVRFQTKPNQFIQKKNRLAVYSYLFKEGVLVAKKDFFKAKHDEIEDVTNLEVLALMKSMKSRGLVRETFNWLVLCVSYLALNIYFGTLFFFSVICG